MYKRQDLAGLTINELNLLAASRHTQLPAVQSPGTASDKAYIGVDAAAQAAMQAAGVSEAQILKTELDAEDGRMVYEVEFVSGEWEYEYDIDAATGEVVKSERERYDAVSYTHLDVDKRQRATISSSREGKERPLASHR